LEVEVEVEVEVEWMSPEEWRDEGFAMGRGIDSVSWLGLREWREAKRRVQLKAYSDLVS
jgi:hypothetical protein